MGLEIAAKMIVYILLVVLFSAGIVFFLIRRIKNLSKTMPGTSLSTLEVLEINVPRMDEETDPNASSIASESFFAALHGLLREDSSLQEHISFEISSVGGSGIKFYVIAPGAIVKFVESQIYAQYPTAVIKVSTDYSLNLVEDSFYELAKISLTKNNFFPIKIFRDFEIDPLSAITSSFSEVGLGEEIWFQVIAKPMADVWQAEGHEYVKSVKSGLAGLGAPNIAQTVVESFIKELWEIAKGTIIGAFVNMGVSDKPVKKDLPTALPPKLSATQELELGSIENKLAKMGYSVQIRLLCSAKNTERVQSLLRSTMASMKQFSSIGLNGFTSLIESDKNAALGNYRKRLMEPQNSFVLNVEELASVYHLPSSSIETPNISWVYSKKSEPPATLPTEECNYMGETIFRSHKVRFGIANADDRLRHMYLIGKSGTGKSSLLETMITQDIRSGFGVGVLDPHGETIDKVLERIPDDRVDDVIYFDPSDTERPVGLNLLELEDASQKNLMASGLVAAIKHHFDYSWGPRLEYILNYSILTLLDVPGTTMLGITRLLEDDNYRRYILHFVKDPVTNRFWEREFKDMKGNQKLVTEAIAPIQNKVNRFLASTTIRNILGQRHSTINFWDAMNNGKIILMNLSKGKIGSDNSNLLGALLVSRIQFMALQRARIPSEQRRPFYLYVDEFQNFATGSFEEILSESRKYGLGLYLTHQFTGQLSEELLKAVFGNVGTIASFAVGAPDARVLAQEFAPFFDENDLISLERFHIYIKLMINGMTSLPFSARILLPWEDQSGLMPKTGNKERVLAQSREKYGVDRSFVEEKINKWVEAPFDKGMAIAQEIKSKKEEEVVSAAGK